MVVWAVRKGLDICEEANLRFRRVRKVPKDRRTLAVSRDFTFAMQMTKVGLIS